MAKHCATYFQVGTGSTQSCPCCGATPTDFVTKTDLAIFLALCSQSSLQHGVCSMHCWIRFFEFLYNIGCKLETGE